MIDINGYTCKRCDNHVVMYSNPEIGENIHHCYSCGWQDSKIAREDENGFILDKDGEVIIDEITNEGFGVFSVCRHDDMVEVHSFSKPITEEEIGKFLIEIIRNKHIIAENSYLSVWNNESKKLEMFYGELPSMVILEEENDFNEII